MVNARIIDKGRLESICFLLNRFCFRRYQRYLYFVEIQDFPILVLASHLISICVSFKHGVFDAWKVYFAILLYKEIELCDLYRIIYKIAKV